MNSIIPVPEGLSLQEAEARVRAFFQTNGYYESGKQPLLFLSYTESTQEVSPYRAPHSVQVQEEHGAFKGLVNAGFKVGPAEQAWFGRLLAALGESVASGTPVSIDKAGLERRIAAASARVYPDWLRILLIAIGPAVAVLMVRYHVPFVWVVVFMVVYLTVTLWFGYYRRRKMGKAV